MDEQEQILVSQIVADARKRAARTKQRAEAEAERIVADAAREGAAARESALKEARAYAVRREEIGRGHVQQEIRKLRLQRHQEVLDRARAETGRRLAQLAASPEYRESLRKLALQAIEAMSGERFQVVLRPEDRKNWGDWLAAELKAAVRRDLGRNVELELSWEPLESIGGLIVKGADGHELADQTFEARLARLWEQMRGDIAALLPDAGVTE